MSHHYSGNLKSLNNSSSALEGESDEMRRARLIVDGDRATVGHGPNAATMAAVERERNLQRMAGGLPGQKGSHNLPGVANRTDESTGYSEAAIQSALVELSKREDGEAREDDGGYIVEKLRREDAERSRNAWQK